jgi:hypothetical protein
MSQNLSNPLDATHNTPTAAEPKPVHIDLRLRAVDQSDRSIVSNITGVHLGSGFAFIDFGFIEHAALNDVTRAARSGEQKNPTLDGARGSDAVGAPDRSGDLLSEQVTCQRSVWQARPAGT